MAHIPPLSASSLFCLFCCWALPSFRPNPIKECPNRRRPIHESPFSRRLPRSPHLSTFPFSLCPLPRLQQKGFWERKDCHCRKKGEKVKCDEFPKCAPLIWEEDRRCIFFFPSWNCTKHLTKHATELPILGR